MLEFLEYNIIASYNSTSQRDDRTKLKNALEKVRSFEKFDKGWDFGEGQAIDKEVINKAIAFLVFGNLLGFSYNARPATNGGIILTFYIQDDFIYVQINPDNTYDWRYEKGIGEEY